VYEKVVADRRIKVRQIAEALAINVEQVHFIFFGKWLPQMLEFGQKAHQTEFGRFYSNGLRALEYTIYNTIQT